MTRYVVGEIMDLACNAGKIMLENGGEIYRVEDTVLYICKSFGLEECECYATPTTIIISAVDTKREVYSRMMRIAVRTVNLHKVASINDLSREIVTNSISITEARNKLQKLNSAPAYRQWLTVFAAAFGTGAFTIIFGGDFRYFLCGIVMGAGLRLLVTALGRIKAGDFTANLIGGASAAMGSWLLTYIGILSEWWIISLASLMLLVPGLLFTNALRDIAAGDLVSGISRGIEAFSIASALACGAAATLTILTQLGGGVL